MKSKFSAKKALNILLLVAVIFGITYLQKNNENEENTSTENVEEMIFSEDSTSSFSDINALTAEDIVVEYVKKHGELPDYYLTKNEAKSQGWIPVKGNLCDVLPEKAIGGDRFGNREKKLPNKKGRIFYEADLNYDCGKRNADRLVFSNDGLIYITKDHYKTFQKQ